MGSKKFYINVALTLAIVSCMLQVKAAPTSSLADSTRLNRIYVNVKYRQALPNDSLSLFLVSTLNFSRTLEDESRHWKKVGEDGLYHFELLSKENQGYFQVTTTDRKNSTEQYGFKRSLTEPLFWEKGDSITVDLSNVAQQVGINSTISFSGRGSEKYNIEQMVIKEVEKDYQKRYPTEKDVIAAAERPIFDKDFNFQSVNHTLSTVALEILEKNRAQISDISYNVLKANFLFAGASTRYQYAIHDFMVKITSKFTEKERQQFLDKYKSNFSDVDFHEINPDYIAESKIALAYLVNKFEADSYVYKETSDPLYIYNSIKANLNGKLRDRTLIYMMNNSTRLADNMQSLLLDARSFMRDTLALEELNNLDRIYNNKDFLKYSLTGLDGKPVKLSKFKGKIVLLDFFFGGCGACMFYYKDVLSKIEQTYKNDKDVRIIAVSADKNKAKWLKTIKEGKLTNAKALNLITNYNGFKDRILTENQITLYPSTALIDRNGNVKFFNTANLYNLKNLISSIESLR